MLEFRKISTFYVDTPPLIKNSNEENIYMINKFKRFMTLKPFCVHTPLLVETTRNSNEENI
jgi:hypothetical protein